MEGTETTPCPRCARPLSEYASHRCAPDGQFYVRYDDRKPWQPVDVGRYLDYQRAFRGNELLPDGHPFRIDDDDGAPSLLAVFPA